MNCAAYNTETELVLYPHRDEHYPMLYWYSQFALIQYTVAIYAFCYIMVFVGEVVKHGIVVFLINSMPIKAPN